MCLCKCKFILSDAVCKRIDHGPLISICIWHVLAISSFDKTVLFFFFKFYAQFHSSCQRTQSHFKFQFEEITNLSQEEKEQREYEKKWEFICGNIICWFMTEQNSTCTNPQHTHTRLQTLRLTFFSYYSAYCFWLLSIDINVNFVWFCIFFFVADISGIRFKSRKKNYFRPFSFLIKWNYFVFP